MTPALILQFTSVRTRTEDDKTLVGLKRAVKTSAGVPITTTWVEMDVERLIRTLQDTLAELDRE